MISLDQSIGQSIVAKRPGCRPKPDSEQTHKKKEEAEAEAAKEEEIIDHAGNQSVNLYLILDFA